MFLKILNRFRRAPAFALSVVLLASILTASLCGLQAANETEQLQYDELVKNTPVKLVVSNLTGTRWTDLNAPNFVLKAFINKDTENTLEPYIKDVRMRMESPMDSHSIGTETTSGGEMVGINSLDVAPELLTPMSDLVTWVDGYSEKDLQSRKNYCIVPESWISQSQEILFSFSYGDGWADPTFTAETMTVIGTHTGSDETAYCPFQTLRSFYSRLRKPLAMSRIEATLIDNSQIDEVREVSKAWFAEPSATGAKTPWRYSYYFSYPFALRFDDDILVNAERTLRTSMLINEICAWLLFVLSAGASFFVGFLMIRSRKREITLMRSIGVGNLRIFLEFALEQLLCLLVGVLLGGFLFQWQPADRVLTFMGIYFVGLSVALLIFLRRNLLATIKEDE